MNPVLIILFALHFLNDGVRTVFLSLLPFIAKDLHLSFIQIGFLSALLGVILAAFSIPAGFLAKKFGGFKVLFTALLFYSLGCLVVGSAINYGILLGAYILAALGYGAFHIVSNVLISRSSEKKDLGRNLSDNSVTGDAGRILLPMIAVFLTAHIGWRETFFIVAGFGIVTYIVTQWLIPKQYTIYKMTSSYVQSYKEWISELPLFLRNKRILLVIFTNILDNFASNPLFIFLPFFILARGFSATTLGIFIASFFVGSLVGKIFIGRSINLFGSAWTFVLAECLMGVTIIFLTLSYQFFLLLGVCFLLGAFARGTGPIVNVLYAEIVHEEHYEKIFGISETITGIGITIAPLIAGIVADTFGIVAYFLVAACFAVFASFPILVLIKGGPIKEMRLAPAEDIE